MQQQQGWFLTQERGFPPELFVSLVLNDCMVLLVFDSLILSYVSQFMYGLKNNQLEKKCRSL